MRTNLPVTNVEHVMREGEFIVSKTDTRGVITYVNNYFVEMSGYSEKELLGAPHNIVRHPDMPEGAFQDLWDTLGAGKPWSGYVKNRCKNGDYYWVLANATPIEENGRISGYLSVRSRPDPAVVAAVDKIYRQFKDGTAQGLGVREGKVIQTGLIARARRWFNNLSLRTRITSIIVLMLLMVLQAGGMSLHGMANTALGLQTVYAERVEPLRRLKTLADDYAVAIIDAANKANAGLLSAEEALGQMKDARQRIADAWKPYQESIHDADEKAQAVEAAALMQTADKAVEGAITRLAGLSGKVPGQLNDIDGPLYAAIDPVSAKLSDLIDTQMRLTALIYAGSQEHYGVVLQTTLVFVSLGFLLSIFLGVYAYRTLSRPLARVSAQMQEIARGHFNLLIDKERNDEVGALLDSFKSMYIRLGFDLAEARRVAEQASRIQIALDSSTAAITVSGSDGLLIHMTPAARTLMQSIGGDSFDVDKLIGGRITDLFDAPEVRAKLEAAQKNQSTVDVYFHNHHLRLAARPIVDAHGQHLGRVTQWSDRTLEVVVELEVAELINAAAAGDFSQRILEPGKEGFFLQLAQGINKLVEASERGITDVGVLLKALAQGDLTQRMTGDYQGLFAQLRDDANATVERLQEIVTQIHEATDAINTAAREIASGNVD
ncbi:MAG: PAS domain-containing protein, partial [Betaproteobacteria bacterium]|nr:PAS domain-containing protein [Betaproteobacteria bacterium]